jgi:hypothetical protein
LGKLIEKVLRSVVYAGNVNVNQDHPHFTRLAVFEGAFSSSRLHGPIQQTGRPRSEKSGVAAILA